MRRVHPLATKPAGQPAIVHAAHRRLGWSLAPARRAGWTRRAALGTALATAVLLLGTACAPKLNLREVELRHGGRDREALLLLPDGDVEGKPLLLLLHGGGGSAAGLARHLRGQAKRLSRNAGWAIAFADGIGRSWNDGRVDVDAEAHRQGVDDVGALRALVLQIAQRHGLDRGRIYVAGISNGGFMAQRLACEAADVFAAAVSVTAQMSVDLAPKCQPSRPIAVALINGTLDPIVPYGGGQVTLFGKPRGAIWSTDDTIAFWRRHNGCEGDPVEVATSPVDGADPTRGHSRVWRTCRGAAVGLVRVEGGGHTWPGAGPALPEAIVGKTSSAFDVLSWMEAFVAPPAQAVDGGP